MFGPDGALGSEGGPLRPAGTKPHRIAVPFAIQLQPAPMPVMACVAIRLCPVAMSATCRSMRSCRVFVKNRNLPFGENSMAPIRAPAGTSIFRSAPVAIVRSVIPVPVGVRCGPLLRGLIRRPANRSIGCDTSSIDGMLRRDVSAIT